MLADIIVIAAVAAFAAAGYKRGIMRALVGAASYVLSLAAAFMLYPRVSEMLMKTEIYPKIADAVCKNYVSKGIQEKSAETFGVFSKYISRGAESAAESVSQGIAALIVSIIAFILVVLAGKLIIWAAARMMNVFSRLPVISQFNRLGGAVLGGMTGLLVLYVAAAALVLFAAPDGDGAVEKQISQSTFAKGIYEDNFILNFMAGGKTKNEA